MGYKFRTLKAEEIECRVGQISEDYFTLLLYTFKHKKKKRFLFSISFLQHLFFYTH